MKKQLTIKQARDKIAAIIAKGEQQYLPIFIRLDQECQKHKQQQFYLEKALHVSTQSIHTTNLLQDKLNHCKNWISLAIIIT